MKRLSQAFLLVLATNVAVPMEASFFDFWKAAAPKPVIQVQVPSEISTGKLVLGVAAATAAAVAFGCGCYWLMNKWFPVKSAQSNDSGALVPISAQNQGQVSDVTFYKDAQGLFYCTATKQSEGPDHCGINRSTVACKTFDELYTAFLINFPGPAITRDDAYEQCRWLVQDGDNVVNRSTGIVVFELPKKLDIDATANAIRAQFVAETQAINAATSQMFGSGTIDATTNAMFPQMFGPSEQNNGCSIS